MEMIISSLESLARQIYVEKRKYYILIGIMLTEIDMNKHGCTLPHLANVCLHKTTKKNSIHFAKLTEICDRQLERI